MKRYFQFDELGTNYKTEFIAGLTTFLSMAYVLFVNPATLSLGNVKGLPAGTGMDPGAVFVATALAAAIGSLIMGIFAKYPIALAPGMGINAFFAYTAVLTMGIPWQTAIAGTLMSGIIFIILTASGIREKIINAIPSELKFAVAAGIGLFIAFLGFQNAGIIVKIEGKNLYMFVSGIPEGEVIYDTQEGPFPFLIGVLVFIFSFFYITKKKMKQIEAMAEGVKEIEKGNLAYRIEKKGEDEIASLTENINNMAEELMNNIEKERKLEKQKNELITNVSHDLRTPLTSIMGYLRLLRDSKYENQEQHDEYTRIAFAKSEQLKNLIEDLFEYTKLTNEQVVLEKQEVCMNELLEQLIEELVPQAEEHGLTFVKKFPEERAYASIDSEKMVRVFDNLLMNAIKYSKDDGEIKVSLQRQRRDIQIVIANHSEEFTREELANLFERFYKKDQSRSRVTEGSGLGLAIAKSIVELQGGSIRAEYEEGIIRFIVSLPIIEK
ncbi:solute carrier family 23 protein [Bacillus thuringiensis]|uniref:solute carrier family 23 protein n=2 Tax=Bacillus cereus group TaxID=86661 RepID=UPI003BF6AFB3